MLLIELWLYVACVVVAVKSECAVNASVTGKERLKQEELLHVLDPIIGKRSGQLKAEGRTYDFVVCGDVDGRKNVGLIEKDSDNLKIVLGYNNQTLVKRGEDWLMLTLLGGNKSKQNCNVNMSAQSHVLFICDPHQNKVQIHTLIDDRKSLSCAMMFIVRHSCVCTISSEGLGAGAIFFIIILVSFGIYFTFGFFYLRVVRGAKGVEQIPNRLFWFRIGNMLADGCGAVCRCDRYCGGTSSVPNSYGGYSPIEERLAEDLQETDRDTALLSP